MSQGRVPVVSPDVAAGKSSRRVVTVLVTVVALVVALTAGWCECASLKWPHLEA